MSGERLTYWNEEYGCWSYHCPSGDAASHLAAYEDTGLMPEEITELNTFVGSQVEKLLAENARLKTEKDAAVDTMGYITCTGDVCTACRYRCKKRRLTRCAKFEWRGLEADHER